MSTETRIYQRQKLYDEVWADPVTEVCARYGVSGSALAKICHALGVPRPPRGYWRRLETGTADVRPPLPALKRGQRDEIHVTQSRSERKPAVCAEEPHLPADVLAERDPARRVPIPHVLESPHPLVATALKRMRAGDLSMKFLHTKPCLAIGVTEQLQERALRTMDALLKALEQRGWRVEVTKPVEGVQSTYGRWVPPVPSQTCVHISDVLVRISLVEDTDRVVVHPEPTPAQEPQPHAARRRSPAWVAPEPRRPRIEYRPNGHLAFQLACDEEAVGARTRFGEAAWVGEGRSLNKVLEGMLRLAHAVRARRSELAALRLRWEEAQRDRAAAERRVYEEQQRVGDLDRRVAAWVRADDTAAFIHEVEHAARAQSVSLEPGTHLGDWVAWAHRTLDGMRAGTLRNFPDAPNGAPPPPS